MISENLAKINAHIAEISEQRRADMIEKVQLVAVTKNHTVSEMSEAVAAGATVVGENRVQEAMEKYQQIGDKVKWHLIGHLQTNKVKHAVQIFDLIESIDSIKLAETVNKQAAKINKVQDILVQVNLVKEESKTGVYLEDLPALLKDIDQLTSLKLCGLMFVAPKVENLEDVRPMFHRMYELFRDVQKSKFVHADIKYLSMGMTHDYKIAIEEGANIVRIGTAIFGPRQY